MRPVSRHWTSSLCRGERKSTNVWLDSQQTQHASFRTSQKPVGDVTDSMTIAFYRQTGLLYLSRLLQVVMVGGDCCEDRNHRQLNVSARKPLGGLLQPLWNQPICHLSTHTKKWETYSDFYVQTCKSSFVCRFLYPHYHAAECRTELVQAARRREQQHFVLQHPR